MTRLISPGRHGEPVEVRRGGVGGGVGGSVGGSAAGDDPDQFLWRDRLYVVRSVLSRWTESGGWWRGAADVIDDGARDWWRVEADSGRHAAMSAGTGVYDLCFDWSRGAWLLARVMD
jgi:hypothetical protein